MTKTRRHHLLMYSITENDLLDFSFPPFSWHFLVIFNVMLGLLGGVKGTTYCLVMSSKFNRLGQELHKSSVKMVHSTQPKNTHFFTMFNQAIVSMQICNSGLANKY